MPYIHDAQNTIHINHPLCTATILKQGAQLISWSPKGLTEVLWSADIDTYNKGNAFRGGIPVCWPWFGKSKSPSHGFARLLPWELEQKENHANGVLLKFTLSDTTQTRAIWPHPFKLTLEIRLGLSCEIHLQITAPIQTTGALHTYLRIDDISKASISGLGKHFTDALQAGKQCSSSDDLAIDAEVDRVYTHSMYQNTLKNEHNTIHVTHSNYSDVVVWNPWIETSSLLEDMKQNDYKKMICIETARINTVFNTNDTLSVKISSIKTKELL